MNKDQPLVYPETSDSTFKMTRIYAYKVFSHKQGKVIPQQTFIGSLKSLMTANFLSMTLNYIIQGNLGDCWFLSSLATVLTAPALMEKICVAVSTSLNLP